MPKDSGSDERGRVVAVGLLTQDEVSLIGAQLSRLYPIKDDCQFADLIEAIDQADRDFHRQVNVNCK